MYTIHVQFFEDETSGHDVVQPLHLEIVGSVLSASEAVAYARALAQHDAVAAVWVRAEDEPLN
jgi:hypothetical protein